ncbi:MAG: SDR family oxidoreductase [Anaerosomatales bacterium]|nr:SDR family oxidoreductase [Anaerosomatales bacterium]
MADLTGKVALVTGAASGIGRESALAFARAGAKVVVSDVMVEGGEETVAMIRDGGGDAIFVQCDVSREDDVKALVARTVEAYGRLDCAHNNAGIEGMAGPCVECTEENWDRTLGINLKGVWWCAKYEIPEMLKVGGGAIVNTASVAGLVGFAGIPAYTASKHGVVGLTKAIALDYATQNIRCNAVCPGVIHTPMIERFTGGDPEALKGMEAMEPVGRLGKPSEIADAVVYLCSDEASFITGAALPVDGAFVAQ